MGSAEKDKILSRQANTAWEPLSIILTKKQEIEQDTLDIMSRLSRDLDTIRSSKTVQSGDSVNSMVVN